jgi:predicted metal-binding membrane protein
MTGAGFLLVWTATMAAMMLPSTMPLLRLDYATTRSQARLAALAGGYLAVWIAVGSVVVAVDALIGPHGYVITTALITAAVLYQLTPLKRRCLARCRAPLARALLGWRDGIAGAAQMGVANGIWCAGCCAGLMAALIGLGVMSWLWMSVVATAILLEKTTPLGAWAL